MPFASLVESGLVTPGTELTDAKGRWRANVRADGTIAVGGEAASIHRIGAKVQGLDACNGWTFWHVRENGRLRVIDELRQIVRDQMAGRRLKPLRRAPAPGASGSAGLRRQGWRERPTSRRSEDRPPLGDPDFERQVEMGEAVRHEAGEMPVAGDGRGLGAGRAVAT